MHQPVRDLFGEVPVTWPEINAWLEAVPGIPRDSWRAAPYIRGYNVAGKVAATKLAGTYWDIVKTPRTRYFSGPSFGWV